MMYRKLLKNISLAGVAVVLAGGRVKAHEAWLLTPSEVEALSRAPVPGLFTDPPTLVGAALVAGLIACAALYAEDRWQGWEARLTAPLAAVASGLGLLGLRIGLALMLALGALGALPREGTAPWSQPVLFVPDMQLSLAPGWGWMGPVELALAGFLVLGLATRLMAILLICLSILGFLAFGLPFLSYAPHFAAPALILAVFGSGWLAFDRLSVLPDVPALGARQRQLAWSVALAMIGGTFVYLGIMHKLFQPTLFIAILEHGRIPTFGLGSEVAALVMTGVEITAGLLLALGRLVRPVALFLIGAFSFFAVMLGESPLFHANLYAVAIVMLFSGARAPDPLDRTPPRLAGQC